MCYLFHCYEKNNFKEEGFIWAHGFRGLDSWPPAPVCLSRKNIMILGVCGREIPHVTVDRKGKGTWYDFQSCISSDLLPPKSLHLPKFQLPKVVSPAGDQAFNTGVYGGILYSKRSTLIARSQSHDGVENVMRAHKIEVKGRCKRKTYF